MPDVRPSRASRLFDRMRGVAATWVATRHSLIGLGGMPEHQRALAALAQLQVLPMPSALRAAVDASVDYMIELGESRAPEVVARWPDVYGRLHDTKGLIETRRGR